MITSSDLVIVTKCLGNHLNIVYYCTLSGQVQGWSFVKLQKQKRLSLWRQLCMSLSCSNKCYCHASKNSFLSCCFLCCCHELSWWGAAQHWDCDYCVNTQLTVTVVTHTHGQSRIMSTWASLTDTVFCWDCTCHMWIEPQERCWPISLPRSQELKLLSYLNPTNRRDVDAMGIIIYLRL